MVEGCSKKGRFGYSIIRKIFEDEIPLANDMKVE
jgi:hypothetical protein